MNTRTNRNRSASLCVCVAVSCSAALLAAEPGCRLHRSLMYSRPRPQRVRTHGKVLACLVSWSTGQQRQNPAELDVACEPEGAARVHVSSRRATPGTKVKLAKYKTQNYVSTSKGSSGGSLSNPSHETPLTVWPCCYRRRFFSVESCC